MNGIASDRRTKILCTIGPSSSDPSVLKEMMKEGMNAARLNFSHGEHSVHLETIQKIRQVQKDLGGIPFAIVQDLQGPKIRIGKLGKSFMIVEGEEIVITIDKSVIASGEDDEPRPRKVSTSYPNLVRDCRPGSRLMIDDGYLEVHVVSKNQEETEMVCKVVTGGMLSQRKGINMVDEGATISAPALTEKDINDLEFGMKSGEINYVCLSFVRTAQDIIDAKNLMIKFAGKTIPIIAKIERIEAIRNIDDILKEADGLMVARGDLMIETNFHELPIFQKELIEKSSKAGKIDITATQMLQSMVESKIPTRAEVTDVSNACFDGTDVVMLSNESAMGKYPVLSVKTMHLIVRTADINYRKFARLDSHDNDFNSYASDSIENASCMAAASIANKHSGVKLICCITNSGKTAVNISQYRPSVPIIALTDQDFTFNRLTLGWGITPVLISNTDAISGPHNVEQVCCKYLVEKSFAKQGDLVVLVIGAETVNHMAHTVRLLKLP